MTNSNNDVNIEVVAYSVKQAKLKAFFQLKQKSEFKGVDNNVLMGHIKKLRITEK